MIKIWDCKNNAGLRPALFFYLSKINLNSLEELINEINNIGLVSNGFNLFQYFESIILELLDSFWAPIVVRNIYETNLIGKNSKEKYANFFIDKNLKWTISALNIKDKYYNQFNIIANIINTKINSIIIFLKNYLENHGTIKTFFELENTTIKNLNVGLSDEHNNLGSCICITFLNNKKILYKPRSSNTDILLNNYIDILNLNGLYKIIKVKTITTGQYCSWHEYIKQTKTNNKVNLQKFYTNFGSILAILDSLNYSDGHNENFVASNNKFILIDTETIFTNFSYYENIGNFYQDLSFTGIIQNKKVKEKYFSALQNKEIKSYFPIYPHVLNDCTDKLKISYRLLTTNKNNKNFPSINKKINIKQYLPFIKNGMLEVYNKIDKNKNKLINFILLNNEHIEFRQIKRPTLYYIWLMHKMLHPLNKNINIFLQKHLSNYSNSIITYEVEYLLTGNVPLFYHKLNSKNLLGFNNKIIEVDHFSKPTIYWFEKK